MFILCDDEVGVSNNPYISNYGYETSVFED